MNVQENREAGLLKRLKGKLEKVDAGSQEAKDLHRMIDILQGIQPGGKKDAKDTL
jgi:hypothetical protein